MRKHREVRGLPASPVPRQRSCRGRIKRCLGSPTMLAGRGFHCRHFRFRCLQMPEVSTLFGSDCRHWNCSGGKVIRENYGLDGGSRGARYSCGAAWESCLAPSQAPANPPSSPHVGDHTSRRRTSLLTQIRPSSDRSQRISVTSIHLGAIHVQLMSTDVSGTVACPESPRLCPARPRSITNESILS